MTEPSAFYKQHVALDAPQIDSRAFRPFWRVRTGLDALLLDGAISYIEWRAARLFRALCERVLSNTWRTQSFDRTAHSEFADALAITRRADAIGDLRRIRLAVGPVVFALLEAHVVNDEPWTRIARRFDVHRKTVRAWTIAAIKMLATVIFT
jgi:hypothetical protein